MNRKKACKLNQITETSTLASNLGYLALPRTFFFMGAKLFIWTPLMRNEVVLKMKLVWAM